MTERQRRFFTAPTLDRALLEAAGYLGVDVDAVRYREVEKKKGLSRGRGVTIRLLAQDAAPESTGDSEEKAEEKAGSTPRSEAADEADALAEPSEFPAETRQQESPEEFEGGEFEAGESEPAAVGDEDEEEAREDAVVVAADQEEGIEDAEDADDEAVSAEGEQGSPSDLDRHSEPEFVPGERIALPRGPEDLRSGADGDETEVTRSAARWIDAILDLADLDAEATVEEREEVVWLDLAGPDEDFLLEDSGQLLQTIQHLMPRLMQSDLGRVVPCVADSAGFREYHGERLRVQAVQAAEAVRREGKAISLEPMNPPDRREVHLALAEDPAVDTESSGRGYFKRITVRPA